MKTKLILLVLVLTGMTSFGQQDFKWDVVSDTLNADSSQLYSKTKLFIAETWKSGKDVIQNDDKESGNILVKGVSVQDLYYQMNNHIWTFSYSIKFLFKDNKCRIIIDNVQCIGARVGQYEWAHMPVSDVYPESKGMKITGVAEKKYLEIMTGLKQELQYVVDSYFEYVQKPLDNESGW